MDSVPGHFILDRSNSDNPVVKNTSDKRRIGASIPQHPHDIGRPTCAT